MTHDDAFLADIIENPDDDSLRLVYSDWLEDNGQPERAEFIHLQIEFATRSEGSRQAELEARERALLQKYERRWLGPMRAWLSGWQFRRGLVEMVSLKAQTLLKNADALFRLAPVQHAEIHRAEKLGRDLGKCPFLARLTSLCVRGLHTSDSSYLIASPHLTGLTSLELPEASLTDAGVQALAASALLARLTVLDLTCNSIHDEGVQALAASPHVFQLERLDLSRNPIGAAGASALDESPCLAGLRFLRLPRFWRGDGCMMRLRRRFGDRLEFV